MRRKSFKIRARNSGTSASKSGSSESDDDSSTLDYSSESGVTTDKSFQVFPLVDQFSSLQNHLKTLLIKSDMLEAGTFLIVATFARDNGSEFGLKSIFYNYFSS